MPSAPMLNGGTHPRDVAIVGCGAVARRLHAKTLPAAGFRIRLVHDIRPEIAESFARAVGGRAATLDEIQNAPGPVLIATPPRTHRALVERLLAPSRIVICEKPFVATLADALALVQRGDAVGAWIGVAHFRRTFPAARFARALITSGALGAVRHLDVAEGERFSWPTITAYTTADALGGVLLDTGSHAVDLALFAAGLDHHTPTIDVHDVRRDKPEPAHEMEAHVSLAVLHGHVTLRLRLSRYECLANRILIRCEHGALAVPLSPRGRVRVYGPDGSSVMAVEGGGPGYAPFFVRQWQESLVDRADWFHARRFLAVTAVLDAITTARVMG